MYPYANPSLFLWPYQAAFGFWSSYWQLMRNFTGAEAAADPATAADVATTTPAEAAADPTPV